MSATLLDDFYDKCALCNKLQNAVSNLNEKPFLINTVPTCGHKFCESCIQRELNRKRSFLCPICNTAVTKDKLSTKTFEEIEVEKDVAMRRKIRTLFNKSEDDFQTQEEYENYQELIEEIIYNLVHEINVNETKQFIENYERENKEKAAKTQLKLISKLKEEEQRMKDEDLAKAIRQDEYVNQLKKEAIEKKVKLQQRNDALLGDSEDSVFSSAAQSSMIISGTTANATVNPGLELMNPVKLFLNQRPDPKVLVASEESKSKKRKDGGNSEMRLMHAAGGYDYSQYDKRNWIEIRSQLTELKQK